MEPKTEAAQCMGVEDLQAAVSAGVVAGLKELASDAEFIERFWLHGYKHLSEHVTNGTTQWVGKRILTTIILAAVTAGIIWLVKSGAIR